MKKLLIVNQTTKDSTELLYNEEFFIRHSNHIDAYIGDLLNQALVGSEQDIESIYNLKNGSYTFALVDSYLDVEIMEREYKTV